MSSDLFNPGSKNADWCNIYSNEVSCNELNIDNVKLPYFKALLTTKNVNIATNANINNYNSVSGSLAGSFNLANGTFVPLKSGYYLFTAKCMINGGAPSGSNFVFYIIGDESIENSYNDNIGGIYYPTVSGIIRCSANQNVVLYVYQSIASPIVLNNIEFGCIMLSEF